MNTNINNNISNINESSSFFETKAVNFDLNFLNQNINNLIEEVPATPTNEYLFKEDEDGEKTYLKLDTKSSVEVEVPTSTSLLQEQLNDDNENIEFDSYYTKYVEQDGIVVKIFICSVCGKEFDHRYKLVRHLPAHSNDRNFMCRDCGKTFRQLSTLSQHQVIHSQDRPFICKLCGKSFNRSSTLISHRKTHSEDKPYRCHLCQKGFHQKGNLKNHIFIHTNLRPYSCEYCDKGFNQMSNLVCHKRRFHPDLTATKWECRKCTKSFTKRTLLRTHEFENHQVTSESKQKKKAKRLPKVIVNDQGILIPVVQTSAMNIAKINNDVPFGVLHLLEGAPLLVRIIDKGQQSLLRPANQSDFNLINSNKGSDKICVSIVASLYQTLNDKGEPIFDVFAPQKMYKCMLNQNQMSDGKQKLIEIKNETLNERRNFAVENVKNSKGENQRSHQFSNRSGEIGRNSKVKRDVLLSSTSKSVIGTSYSESLITSTSSLNEGEGSGLGTSVKTEGYDDSDAGQMKNFFSENGIWL